MPRRLISRPTRDGRPDGLDGFGQTLPSDAALLTDSRRELRQLVWVVCAIQVVDLALLSALVPLLPQLDDRFGLGPAGSGQVIAAYAAGSLLLAIPAGLLASRAGYRATVLLGLAVMAVSSAGFGLAGSKFGLEAARFGQGAGSAISWAAALGWVAAATPRERRGTTLGTVIGASVIGSLGGPGLGLLAAEVGLRWTFGGVAALTILLSVPAALLPSIPPRKQQLRDALRGARGPRLMLGVWLFLFPAFLLAAQSSIAPLHLDELGFSARAIGTIYLIGSLIAIVTNPLLGRWADRSSPLKPVYTGLLAALAVALLLAAPFTDNRWAFATLVVAAGLSFASFFVPASAILADGADEAGVDHGYGFALANLAWSPGTMAGSLIGGALAAALGASATYLMLAALCASSLAVLPAALSRRQARS